MNKASSARLFQEVIMPPSWRSDGAFKHASFVPGHRLEGKGQLRPGSPSAVAANLQNYMTPTPQKPAQSNKGPQNFRVAALWCSCPLSSPLGRQAFCTDIAPETCELV